MSIVYYATTGATGQNVVALSPQYPANNTGTLLLAWGNVSAIDGATRPIVTPPASWVLVQDNGSFGFNHRRMFCYRFLGDGTSGNAIFQFSTPVTGNVDIIAYSEINTTSPIKDSTFRNNTTTTTPTANAVSTTGTNDCMIVCGWGEGGDNYFFTTADFSDVRVFRLANAVPFTGSVQQAITVADGIQSVAGSSGIKTALSQGINGPKPGAAFAIMVAVAPAPNPSVPVLTFPNGGEQLTAGSVVNITWLPATSPTATQASLKYNLDFSANNGGSWTSIVALTSAGVTSFAWTVPGVTGTGYLARIRSNDPALSLYSLAYDQSDAPFSVVAEVAPGQPVITAPLAGSVQNKANLVTVSWLHQGGVGNPQTQYTFQWSRDNFGTHTVTIGPTTTGTQNTSIDFSGEANGATISVKVKTRGVSLYSAYSNILAFQVASLPATPNITAPINASPPTTPLPTITFTEADFFVSRKMRVVQAGVEVYNSGEVASSALSFPSPYVFNNGITVTLFLSVKNPFGLFSLEDSEVLTPAYAGPTAPTLSVLPVDTDGYILLTVTNSGTATYNELLRFESTALESTAIKIGVNLPLNVSFRDYHPQSGTNYIYKARAYNASGLFTDSSLSSSTSITLQNAFLHSVSRTNTSDNTMNGAINLLNLTGQWIRDETVTTVKLLGRSKPLNILSMPQWQRLSASIAIPNADLAKFTALLAAWRTQETGAMLCYRDERGNKIFGKIGKPDVQDESSFMLVGLEIVESSYVEGL